ncbi:MAG: hypothetical protein CVU35_00410 [Betaproteobacteria bacterium HGW-Betaproteobacteria-8]|nr:MAG: hypothetical protein CVU35_00410 [Betaproteobacteria bacterium HGW-Betaproteobacteria-8]
MLKNKQGGFTLLELLVVITLLALLSVGALVAYDGVGDNASSTAAANNMQTVDRTIRQYNAVTGNFPNQWDILSDAANPALPFDGITAVDAAAADDNEVIVPKAARAAFGGWDIAAAGPTGTRVLEVLEDFGIDELQAVTLANAGVLTGANTVPNTAHNEGTNPEALEVDAAALGVGFSAISILPAGAGCTAGGQSIANNFDGVALPAGDQLMRINSINDFLEDRTCNLILALGFGGDAGKSMQNSSVQMTSAPTYASRTVNPARNYGRFVGLFHVAAGAEDAVLNLNDNTPLTAAEAITDVNVFDKPRLIAVLTPEGKTLDEVLADATKTVE